VHLELDEIRRLIVSGLANPQRMGELQAAQYELSVTATCALTRAFAEGAYDVAVDDVFEPDAFHRYWQPRLQGLSWRLVVLLPSVDESVDRSAKREKQVMERHTRTQHERCAEWPAEHAIDTSGLSIDESLALLLERLAEP
jgi:hypothetical protein